MELSDVSRFVANDTLRQPPVQFNTEFRQRIWREHGLIALLLTIFTIVLLTTTAPDIGLTWDEPVYIEASKSYLQWLSRLTTRPGYALSDQGIKDYWELNHEHPPLDKIWSGLIWVGARYVLDDLTAHRLGNIVLAGVLMALVYLMVALDYGRVAGLAAVSALLTMPRFFFHAHLAALDVPVATTIFGVSLLFWWTRHRPGLKWSVWLGLAWGLALATKINALVALPITLSLWMLIFQRRIYLFGRLALMGLIGIPLWLVLWPWFYHDSLSRLEAYIDFMIVHHWQIAQWYLGQLYLPPPWHFPFVMTLAVVPLTLTVMCALGIVRVVRGGWTQVLGWFFIFSALTSMLIPVIGRSQIFDNERLFMPSFPYLATLAGLGFDWAIQHIREVAQRVGRPALAKPLSLLLVGLVFIPPIGFTYGLYPHLLSYYSVTVGGLPGAVRLGFERTYWSETYFEALPYLNAHAPSGAVVWVEGHDVMLYYQMLGKLRRDLRVASPVGAEGVVKGVQGYTASIRDADYAVIQYRESGFYDEVTNWLHPRKPIYQLSYRSIPLMEIYER